MSNKKPTTSKGNSFILVRISSLSTEESKEEKKADDCWAKLNSLNFAKHQSVTCTEETYTIGRAPDNSVHINDIRYKMEGLASLSCL